ncbi:MULTISPECIES: hypothetical protein [Sulfurospirillum]|uniref:Uncharacterized protein n=3 Tax=Sulfurospirillum TaxID=57665 RepID=A0AA86AMF0_SULMK|nr:MULTISPECIES: hypothetical protein [Sulfurospirillum]AHJ13490.1 hypothetical protein SMUL_2237 [Sulfurospirillum multivorans DSM 12446]ARU49223.1 hypothetical protein Sdiek1_2064 [Sulfurospirillum diekertiae]ASC94033.1 hypothetical protein Sdiek2_2018 [Sulfurospirillum diekertiae]QEH06980.1 hypothetical protein SMN_2215 [Sulfurospirillum multivorans]
MSKITISLGGKDFDIKLEGDFAVQFEADFKEKFKEKSTIDPKELLFAYVGKCYDNFVLEQEVTKLLYQIDEI